MIKEVILAAVLGSVGVSAAEPDFPMAPPVPPPSVATVLPRVAATRRPPKTPASFTRDMALSEAIDILRNATTPPLNIIVYWKDLRKSAEIYRDTPIGFDGVPSLRLRQSLEILLTSLSATSPARIGYTIGHGVIVIATTGALPRSRRTTRIHDVTDLAAAPARWWFSPMLNTMMFAPLRRPLGSNPGQATGNNPAPTPRR